jgi:glycosyltransferase involved in cell wall biosynthesis
MRRVFSRKIKLFIAPSNFVKSEVENEGLENVRLLRNSIPTNHTKVDGHDSKRILFSGRIQSLKGIFTLLESFSMIDDRDSRLSFMGTGEDLKNLRKIVAKEKNNNVEIKGFLEGKEFSDEFKRSAFIVVPSVIPENCPISVLEAYSYSKPVVTTNTGGLPEIVKHKRTGLITEPGEPNGLKEALQFLIKNPKRVKKYGKNARIFLDKGLNFERHIKEVRDIYNELI